jgi:ribokinase
MVRSPRIAVVGSVNTDLTTVTNSVPRSGETIFGSGFHLGFGGKGANQAVAARLCGADVLMVAKVGDDIFGKAMAANLASYGIDTAHVGVVNGVSSGVAVILVEPTGQNRIVVVKGANDRLGPADVDAAAADLRGVDAIILQFEIPLDTVYHTIDFARTHDILCIVNPAPALPADIGSLADADYFIPNETEAERTAGLPVHSIGDAEICAAALIQKGLRRVVITLGERGSLVATSGGAELIAPFKVTPVDTTGAGDAFIGSFSVFLSQGLPERDALTRANLYAALSTTSSGAQRSFPIRSVFEAEWAQRATTR